MNNARSPTLRILKKTKPLVVGFLPVNDCAPLAVARELGLFKKVIWMRLPCGCDETTNQGPMKNKWLLVVDLASFKPYRVETSRFTRGPRLELMEAFDNAEAHSRLVGNVSDLAGRFPKAMGTTGAAGVMSDGERHNSELEKRKRLARRLAERVNALMRRDDVDICCLAASREINHQILEEVEPRWRAKIEKASRRTSPN